MAVAASSVITSEQVQQFHQDGFLIARGLLSPQQVREIRDTFMEMGRNGPVEGLSEVRPPGGPAFDPNDPLAKYPRMLHPHRHMDKPVGPVARRYMLFPDIGRILEELMGEEPIAVQSMFYFKPPGARGQDLHQDNLYLRVSPGTCMAAWIAVDDADEGNGGMVVVPGSQNMQIVCPGKSDPTRFFTGDHVDVPEGLREQPVRLAAGDVLFFNGNVIHGSYPNTSKDRFRSSLICHYVPASTREVARFYEDPTRFNGEPVTIADATGGGPCGSFQPMGPH